MIEWKWFFYLLVTKVIYGYCRQEQILYFKFFILATHLHLSSFHHIPIINKGTLDSLTGSTANWWQNQNPNPLIFQTLRFFVYRLLLVQSKWITFLRMLCLDEMSLTSSNSLITYALFSDSLNSECQYEMWRLSMHMNYRFPQEIPKLFYDTKIIAHLILIFDKCKAVSFYVCTYQAEIAHHSF